MTGANHSGTFMQAEYAQIGDFGIAISASFVVTKRGGERLCDGPRGLIVID